MKSTIKIPFEDYRKYAIKGLTAAMTLHEDQLNPETIEYKITRHDGDHNIAEIPDFVELEINI